MQNRRSSFNSSTASSLLKRHAATSSSFDRKMVVGLPPDALVKKRAPLGNMTNQRIDRNVANANCKTKLAHSALLPNGAKIAKTRKSSSPSTSNTNGFMAVQTLPRFSNSKSSGVVQSKNTYFHRLEEVVPTLPNRCSSSTMVIFSPARSDDQSVSVDDSMSTCESFKSPDVEYIDNADVSGLHSVDMKAFSNLFISDH